jgi:hypothetical protein
MDAGGPAAGPVRQCGAAYQVWDGLKKPSTESPLELFGWEQELVKRKLEGSDIISQSHIEASTFLVQVSSFCASLKWILASLSSYVFTKSPGEQPGEDSPANLIG